MAVLALGGEASDPADAQASPIELSACLMQTEHPSIYIVRSTLKNFTGSSGEHYLTDGTDELSLMVPKGTENRLFLEVDTRSAAIVTHGFNGSAPLAEHFTANSITGWVKLCLE
ncbi:MAG: hypothetical protein AAGF92_19335 [Myxococcota bacterium]